MVTLPKINIGRKTRRSHLQLQHDGETTANFGFCQPTIARLVQANSKIDLQSKSFTRLAPLPCPTFGRIEVKTHTSFVKINDVFEAFDYMQSQQSVASAIRQYIPQKCDSLQVIQLITLLWDMFAQGAQDSDERTYYDSVPFRVGLWFKKQMTDASLYQDSSPDAEKYVDILNDESVTLPGASLEDRMLYRYRACNSLNLLYYISLNFVQRMGTLLDSQLLGFDNVDIAQYYEGFLSFVANRNPIKNYGGTDTFDPSEYLWNGSDMSDMWNKFDEWCQHDAFGYRSTVQASAMSLENADFIYEMNESNILSILNSSYDPVSLKPGRYFITLHLTQFGKKLIGKILSPLKIFFSNPGKEIELPKLFAVYKAWFDKYNPGRNLQWRDTNCYKLIHSYYDSGETIGNALSTAEAVEHIYTSDQLSDLKSTFISFLRDLGKMYYCLPLDNITAATGDPILTNTYSSEFPNNEIPAVTNHGASAALFDAEYPYGYTQSEFGLLGGLGIKLMERLYYLAGKNSTFGAKIEDYCRAHGISFKFGKTNVLGDDSYMCNISDVIGTVNNDETALGEYAGKGIGYSDGHKMHYETDSFGYLIQLLTVVPLGGYVQGNDVQHIYRYDYYQPEFDSLGKEALPYDEVFGRKYILSHPDGDQTFGFVPRYFRDKVITNTSAGDFALRGSQGQFLPYTLNRLFSDRQYVFDEGKYIDKVNAVHIYPDESLRFIGKDEYLGNYDRIFYDATGLTDNFIIHIVHDLDIYSPCKPVSDSFDTFDKDTDDTTISTEHA